MGAYETVLVAAADHVATVTINRPEKRNALSPLVIAELRAALEQLRCDESVRVVVLTGAGDRAFCAGADLVTPGIAGGDAAESPAVQHERRGELARLFEDLWSLGKPTIARVRGFALAGGFGLALACDLIVAADDAVFATPEIDVGLWPMMITVPMLRAMPPKLVLELQLTGRRMDATEAQRAGIVNRVVPAAELDAATAELAATIAAKSPAIVKLGRDAFYDVIDRAAAEAFPLLQAGLTRVSQTDDSREGLAAFAEKREPRYTGR